MDATRRRFLTGAAALGAVSALPLSLQKAMAAAAPPGGLGSIEHVVFLMQENRSFDHYFGALKGVRGFGDRNVIMRRNGRSVFEQPGYARDVKPFPVRDAIGFKLRPAEARQFFLDLDHGWDSGHTACNNGWNDNWIPAKTPGTMAFFDRRDLPFHYELADNFTVCDAYHCSVLSSTNPNRLYHYAGNVGFEPNGGRTTDNAANGDDHPGYTYKTVAETLQAAGKTWKVYSEWDDFEDNALAYFATFKNIGRKILSREILGGTYQSLNGFYAAVAAAKDPAPLLAALEAGLAGLTPAERELFERGLRRVPAGGLAASFRADVEAGTLPQVSYIAAPSALSEHPGSSAPGRGTGITYDVLDAIAANPEVWASTAVFVTYDENDGLYDHVPPPLPPVSVTEEYVDGRPIGLGNRVPMLVVSPWTVGGNVCSEVFDHTSTVRFLETWLGLRHPEISTWRRTVAGDLTSAFDFRHTSARRSVGEPAPDPGWHLTLPALPPVLQRDPVQEAGVRPARPLPYRPEATARLTTGLLSITMTDSGSRSSHFALYPYAREFTAPQHFDVHGIEVVTVPVTASYRLTLTGPNGFRREFGGSAAGAAAEVLVSAKATNHTLSIRLDNPGPKPLTFLLKALEYGTALVDPATTTVPAGSARTVKIKTINGWYDLAVSVAQDATFARRLMGHLENGKPSVTG
ncbi:MAG: phospholipase C, phosphocholine-specific [Streptosporangiaceae bacterium]